MFYKKPTLQINTCYFYYIDHLYYALYIKYSVKLENPIYFVLSVDYTDTRADYYLAT